MILGNQTIENYINQYVIHFIVLCFKEIQQILLEIVLFQVLILYVKTMNMGLVGANHSENNVWQYNSSFKANPMLLVNEIFNINSFSLTNKRNHKTDKRENC